LVQKICVSVEEDKLSVFRALLSYGFKLDVQIGGNLLDLLICQIGINESYLNEKGIEVDLNIEVLSRKELQAVLLHEYGHLRGNTSLYKVSRSIYSKIPLLYAFLDGRKLEDEEEIRADAFAARTQGTARYLESAKGKLEGYFGC